MQSASVNNEEKDEWNGKSRRNFPTINRKKKVSESLGPVSDKASVPESLVNETQEPTLSESFVPMTLKSATWLKGPAAELLCSLLASLPSWGPSLSYLPTLQTSGRT